VLDDADALAIEETIEGREWKGADVFGERKLWRSVSVSEEKRLKGKKMHSNPVAEFDGTLLRDLREKDAELRIRHLVLAVPRRSLLDETNDGDRLLLVHTVDECREDLLRPDLSDSRVDVVDVAHPPFETDLHEEHREEEVRYLRRHLQQGASPLSSLTNSGTVSSSFAELGCPPHLFRCLLNTSCGRKGD
jgi:hypothetical protein